MRRRLGGLAEPWLVASGGGSSMRAAVSVGVALGVSREGMLMGDVAGPPPPRIFGTGLMSVTRLPCRAEGGGGGGCEEREPRHGAVDGHRRTARARARRATGVVAPWGPRHGRRWGGWLARPFVCQVAVQP